MVVFPEVACSFCSWSRSRYCPESVPSGWKFFVVIQLSSWVLQAKSGGPATWWSCFVLKLGLLQTVACCRSENETGNFGGSQWFLFFLFLARRLKQNHMTIWTGISVLLLLLLLDVSIISLCLYLIFFLSKPLWNKPSFSLSSQVNSPGLWDSFMLAFLWTFYPHYHFLLLLCLILNVFQLPWAILSYLFQGSSFFTTSVALLI